MLPAGASVRLLLQGVGTGRAGVFVMLLRACRRWRARAPARTGLPSQSRSPGAEGQEATAGTRKRGQGRFSRRSKFGRRARQAHWGRSAIVNAASKGVPDGSPRLVPRRNNRVLHVPEVVVCAEVLLNEPEAAPARADAKLRVERQDHKMGDPEAQEAGKRRRGKIANPVSTMLSSSFASSEIRHRICPLHDTVPPQNL